MINLSPKRHTFFLPGPLGPLFAIYYPPAGNRLFSRQAILHVPAFAEEMNKCRRMVVLQAERFANAGYGVLVVDLYGTGDSGGEFSEARWEVWKADLEVALDWLRGNGVETIKLWGLRMGGLLAVELACEQNNEIHDLVLWQPVVDGRLMLTQFLRLRLAGGMMAGNKQESMATLRQRFAAGELVEVGGYELAPDLAVALDQQGLGSLNLPGSIAVNWLEIVPNSERSFSAMSQRIVEMWRGSGVRVAAATVIGNAFWATQEIALAPKLLDETPLA